MSRAVGGVVAALLGIGPAAHADVPTVEEREALSLESGPFEERPRSDAKPWLGLMVDAGVPDGAQLAAVWRPVHWIRFHGGGGYNLAGFGLRGGLSLVPFDAVFSPSLVVEGGHFFGGDFRGFVADVVGEAPDGTPESLSYSYGNLHLGLELGSDDFTFYLRGGYSLIEATVTPAQPTEGDALRFEGDGRVSALVPSAKLGFVLYVL